MAGGGQSRALVAATSPPGECFPDAAILRALRRMVSDGARGNGGTPADQAMRSGGPPVAPRLRAPERALVPVRRQRWSPRYRSVALFDLVPDLEFALRGGNGERWEAENDGV